MPNYCPDCGAPVNGMKFCSNCGRNLIQTEEIKKFSGLDYLKKHFEYEEYDEDVYEIIKFDGDLEDVTIPENVCEIKSHAFENCKSLKIITIPANVTYIGSDAFLGCENLHTIILEAEIYEICQSTFCGCKSLKRIIIPKGVKTIGRLAFCNCTSLESVFIPKTVNEIEYGAFSQCSALKEINLPDSVKTIGEKAFNCCGVLELNLGKGVKQIGQLAFYGCKNLETLAIPSSVESIDYCAFKCCSKLSKVYIAEGLKTINAHAFEDCSNLNYINFPASLKEVYSNVFMHCPALETIAISEDNKNFILNNGCLINTTNKCYVLGLNGAKIPHDGSIEMLDYNAFKYSDMTHFEIPQGVKIIRNYVFSHCSQLIEIILPDSVQDIGEEVFAHCINLKKIKFKGSQEEWENIHKAKNWLMNCYAEITFNEPYCNDEDTETISVNEPETTALNHGSEEIISPDDLAVLKKQYVYEQNDDGSVTIVRVADRNVKEFVIPQCVSKIAKDAFAFTDINTLALYNGLTEIGEGAFYQCRKLQKITLPPSVKFIEAGAFRHCADLEEIEIPDGIENLGEIAFLDCKKLKKFIVPKTITRLSRSLFMRCESLQNIELHDKITHLEEGAFAECKSLSSIIIPKSVISIGINAFTESGLNEIHYLGTTADWKKIEFKDKKLFLGYMVKPTPLKMCTVYCTDGKIKVKWKRI